MPAVATDSTANAAIPGPVRGAWEEGTLTRIEELRALKTWAETWAEEQRRGAARRPTPDGADATGDGDHVDGVGTAAVGPAEAIDVHLRAAQEAAEKRRRWPRRHSAARLERAISNLDAAEADLLRIAPAVYLLGQMPSILNHVQRHLGSADPRRLEIEALACQIGVPTNPKLGSDQPGNSAAADDAQALERQRLTSVARARDRIVNAVRGASSAALREKARVRSFRDVLVAATVGMVVVAGALIIVGIISPTSIPLCFEPESAGSIKVVCPTEESKTQPVSAAPTTGTPTTSTPTTSTPATSAPATNTTATETAAPTTATTAVGPVASTLDDIDDVVSATASKTDVPLVALVGATAAALAAAGAIRNIRGSSEPYGVPIALAVLKLPSGAVTALLGLLLMRGGFVPGLSALDTSAQIVGWAILFGYAQQLFTRLVDQQAHTVLGDVRGSNRTSAPQKSE